MKRPVVHDVRSGMMHGRPYIPAEPLLSLRLMVRAYSLRDIKPKNSMRLFSYARYALVQFVREQSVAEGVLYVPSYICVEAIAPLTSLAQEICYYPVMENLEPDWGWLRQHVDRNGKALLLVHYFGFPNAIEQAVAFCQEHRLLLIEDCAHSFLTEYRGKRIGTFGAAGIYSFRKILPLPDGAGLIREGRNQRSDGIGRVPRFQKPPYLEILKRLSRIWAYRARIALSPRVRRFVSPVLSADQTYHNNLNPQGISYFSYRLMRVLESDFEGIAARRRENYCYLADAFSSFPEVRLLYRKLPEGVCPYLFPILIPNRDRVLEELRDAGIPAQTWPLLPKEVDRNIVLLWANRYSDQLVTLPLHQDLYPFQLQWIVNTYLKVRSPQVKAKVFG